MADRNEAGRKFRNLIGKITAPVINIPSKLPEHYHAPRPQGGRGAGANGNVFSAHLHENKTFNSFTHVSVDASTTNNYNLKGVAEFFTKLTDLFAPHQRPITPLVAVGERLSTQDKRVLSLARSFDSAIEDGTQVLKIGILANAVVLPRREAVSKHPNTLAVAMHRGKGGGHRTYAGDGHASTEAWGEESVGMSIGISSGK